MYLYYYNLLLVGFCFVEKLRLGSGKYRQGMALKTNGLKACLELSVKLSEVSETIHTISLCAHDYFFTLVTSFLFCFRQ